MALMAKKQLTLFDLPEELIAEILKRLPVKYILRCSCVRKSWYHFIKSPMFVTAHLNHQKFTTHNHPKYLFFEIRYATRFMVRYDDVHCENYCELKYPHSSPRDCFWYALAYGLMCVSYYTLDYLLLEPIIYLWNPLIQRYKRLPPRPLPGFIYRGIRWRALAFGFVPETNDYVVVQIVKYHLRLTGPGQLNRPVVIGVYNLSTNSWKLIHQDKDFIRNISEHDAVFVNAAAYWVGSALDKNNRLIRFDTKTDVLREIMLPCRHKSGFYGHNIFPFCQKSVAYICVNNKAYTTSFAMWVMKEGLANDIFWEKKMSVCASTNLRTNILGIRNSGEPILATLYDLISYNLDNHQENRFVDSWNRWVTSVQYKTNYDGYGETPFKIRPFVESLVLFDTDRNRF